MFGEYEHTIDAKGRMFLPAKIRAELGERVFLSRSIDKCICIYPVDEWEKYIARLSELPPVKARNAKRFFCATAAEVEIDGQGRVLIPQTLRDHVGLGKSVTVIGVGEKAEIWNTEDFENFKDKMDPKELEKELISYGL